MCDEKSIFLWNCLKKSICSEIFLENRNIFGNCLNKSKFFGNLTWKIEFFCKITWKNPTFFGNLPWKINFCEIAWKNLNFSEIFLENQFFLPGSTTPQISNQIDAAAPRLRPSHRIHVGPRNWGDYLLRTIIEVRMKGTKTRRRPKMILRTEWWSRLLQ